MASNVDLTPTAAQERLYIRGMFLRVAEIAAIPPENVDAFLMELGGPVSHVFIFESELVADNFRNQRKAAINDLVNATSKMIDAIERVQKYEQPSYADPNDAMFAGILRLKSLADLKQKLAALHENATHFSTSELPKRGENRTKIFLRDVWASVEKFGGRLTYDKHSERGTLTEVIAFFDGMSGWTKLSPSTLDRLRPR
jgi:hypothetical protein